MGDGDGIRGPAGREGGVDTDEDSVSVLWTGRERPSDGVVRWTMSTPATRSPTGRTSTQRQPSNPPSIQRQPSNPPL